MELQYLELIEEHNLKISDLPEDAKVGIDNIKSIVTAIDVAEKKGRRINAQTFKRLTALDKWVCYEILDFVNDTDKNKSPMPKADVVINESKKAEQNNEEPKADGIGYEIEAELEAMHIAGTTDIEFSNLKSVAPKAYNLLFDSYEDDGENGIETSKFKLIEVEAEKFKLSKK